MKNLKLIKNKIVEFALNDLKENWYWDSDDFFRPILWTTKNQRNKYILYHVQITTRETINDYYFVVPRWNSDLDQFKYGFDSEFKRTSREYNLENERTYFVWQDEQQEDNIKFYSY